MIIDVSHHQGVIDWDAVKRSGMVDAVIIRAGYGRELNQVDHQFAANVYGCALNDIPYGFYWYSYAANAEDAKREAEACITVIQQMDPELPVFYDIEESSIPLADRTSCCINFCSALEKAGYTAGIYKATLYKVFGFDTLATQYKYWQADWRASPDLHKDAVLHQYGKTTIPGIKGEVDANRQLKPLTLEPSKPNPKPDNLEQRVSALETTIKKLKEALK